METEPKIYFVAPGNSMLAVATSLATLPDVTIPPKTKAEVLPARPQRCILVVQHISGGQLRAGDSDVGPARGARLGPGEALALQTSDALFVHNPETTPAVLALLYLDR